MGYSHFLCALMVKIRAFALLKFQACDGKKNSEPEVPHGALLDWCFQHPSNGYTVGSLDQLSRVGHKDFFKSHFKRDYELSQHCSFSPFKKELFPCLGCSCHFEGRVSFITFRWSKSFFTWVCRRGLGQQLPFHVKGNRKITVSEQFYRANYCK